MRTFLPAIANAGSRRSHAAEGGSVRARHGFRLRFARTRHGPQVSVGIARLRAASERRGTGAGSGAGIAIEAAAPRRGALPGVDRRLRVFAGPQRLTEHTPFNHYALLADAWLHGRQDLANGAPAYAMDNDFAEFQGKTYISFPPFPAVLMLPFVEARADAGELSRRPVRRVARGHRAGGALSRAREASPDRSARRAPSARTSFSRCSSPSAPSTSSPPSRARSGSRRWWSARRSSASTRSSPSTPSGPPWRARCSAAPT